MPRKTGPINGFYVDGEYITFNAQTEAKSTDGSTKVNINDGYTFEQTPVGYPTTNIVVGPSTHVVGLPNATPANSAGGTGSTFTVGNGTSNSAERSNSWETTGLPPVAPPRVP